MSDWPVEHIDYLRAYYGTTSASEIGNALGRSKNSVVGKAKRLGLKTKGVEWTPEEDAELTKLADQGLRARAMSTTLARTPSAINNRMTRLNLTAPRRMTADRATRASLKGRQAVSAINRRMGERDEGRPMAPADGSRRCQWIDGEPSKDDGSKCGQPTIHRRDGRRSSWCEEHYFRCYPVATRGVNPLGIKAHWR